MYHAVDINNNVDLKTSCTVAPYPNDTEKKRMKICMYFFHENVYFPATYSHFSLPLICRWGTNSIEEYHFYKNSGYGHRIIFAPGSGLFRGKKLW